VLDCGAPGQNNHRHLPIAAADGERDAGRWWAGRWARLRAISETISSDCEPVHICSAWALLSSWRWGFQGPSDRRRRDTPFRARRRSFSKLVLPTRLLSCPALPTDDGEPPAVAGCAPDFRVGDRLHDRIHDLIPIHFRALIQRPASRYVGRERPEAFPP
jgi:hypothetical protein